MLYCTLAGNQINDNNDNREEEQDLDKIKINRSPYEALDVIKKQETHNLYCPKCTDKITQTAQLFEIGNEPYPYNNQSFVLWVPHVFPSLLSCFRCNWGGLRTILKNLVRNCLPWLSPTSLRFLLVAVLLLLSVIVLWSSPSPSPLPGPISPLPRPDLPSPSLLAGPISPLPRPDPPSPSPLPGPIFPLPRPDLPSLSPLPGPFSPLPRPGPPSLSSLSGPISPLPRQDLPSPSLLAGPISPLPRPGPPSPSPPSGLSSPPTQPGLHLHNKIGWLIHFTSIKYLSVLSLLFLAILALPWPSISFKIKYLVEKIKRVWPPAPVPAPTPTPVKILTPTPDPGLDSVPASDQTPDTTPPPLIRPPLPPPPHVWTRIVVLIQKLIPRELDILKSIVYGGLIESITSLGVVSSAAASGASTLNVLALGLAKLFSGLFLIIHNLYGLITSQPRFQSANFDPMTYVVTEDPYQHVLGNRRKVKLHCFVVVVSLIFFGVIPPIFYGLSFKRTDNGHYKAAVVLAASLVCVISLSFAKAYAFGMRKLKTVAEYTGMAIGASVLSFIASQIVADLFEKYGFHELASDCRKG